MGVRASVSPGAAPQNVGGSPYREHDSRRDQRDAVALQLVRGWRLSGVGPQEVCRPGHGVKVQTIVRVEGVVVGWLDDDGTFFRGDQFTNLHPVAHAKADGSVDIIGVYQGSVGWVDADGSVRENRYDAPLATVSGGGDLLAPDGRVLATGEGPDGAKAAAAYLFLTRYSEAEEAKPSWGDIAADITAVISAFRPETTLEPAVAAAVPTPEDWTPGDPYPARLVADPDGPGPRGLLGRGPKRAGAFRVGDRVEVTTLSFQGAGTVLDVSNTWERGHGTKLYPTFLVHFDPEDGRGWFNGISLRKVP